MYTSCNQVKPIHLLKHLSLLHGETFNIISSSFLRYTLRDHYLSSYSTVKQALKNFLLLWNCNLVPLINIFSSVLHPLSFPLLSSAFTTILLSISIWSTFVDFIYEWDHVALLFLCLPCLTWPAFPSILS